MSASNTHLSAPSVPVNQELFEVKKVPKRRNSNHDKCTILKAQFGIQTHCIPDRESKSGRNWLALSMPAAVKLLDGYGLDDEEKAVLSAIIAGYGRLIDESGLSADGYPTEYAAVQAAAAQAQARANEGGSK